MAGHYGRSFFFAREIAMYEKKLQRLQIFPQREFYLESPVMNPHQQLRLAQTKMDDLVNIKHAPYRTARWYQSVVAHSRGLHVIDLGFNDPVGWSAPEDSSCEKAEKRNPDDVMDGTVNTSCEECPKMPHPFSKLDTIVDPVFRISLDEDMSKMLFVQTTKPPNEAPDKSISSRN